MRDEEAHGYQTIELRTPAQGDGFEFTVVVHCDWCAIGVPAEVVGEYRRLVPRRVQDAVRPLARQYPPHQPDLAEQAINSKLREGWCFDGGALDGDGPRQPLPQTPAPYLELGLLAHSRDALAAHDPRPLHARRDHLLTDLNHQLAEGM